MKQTRETPKERLRAKRMGSFSYEVTPTLAHGSKAHGFRFTIYHASAERQEILYTGEFPTEALAREEAEDRIQRLIAGNRGVA